MHHKLVRNINSIFLSKLRKFIAKQSINLYGTTYNSWVGVVLEAYTYMNDEDWNMVKYHSNKMRCYDDEKFKSSQTRI